eukprot:CAMPEP_0194774398 /NCGR_PEP_ID=MMETSP0323_2-20130528/57552_1 /TAXON_ID=2866 ORGANISM="Crypthecodinium cohnii, Strain Seligo" /NCGR_SAMPLE_ID=MMETSP0323_2 /ASSEMBLY_ACC=CAM_ASM_000346 /LENGTH=109 /DNA_ID=CAMNT_0039709917 /DNA_START=94 /DNA_END=423 /DNA_ORIENTATION=+
MHRADQSAHCSINMFVCDKAGCGEVDASLTIYHLPEPFCLFAGPPPPPPPADKPAGAELPGPGRAFGGTETDGAMVLVFSSAVICLPMNSMSSSIRTARWASRSSYMST